MSIKNFVVKNGLTVGNANIDASSGNLFTGNANLGNLATANFFTGALTTNAQPNITSVGTLTGLTVNGVSNLGANGNVIITGGTSGQFLQTNGSGNLSWVTVGTSGISNGNSSVSVPVANGNIIANVDGNTTMVITSTGANITGYANISGNANVANLGTGGLIVATGNIDGGNLNTGGVLSVTGNANVGNLGTGGLITATGTVTGGNLSTAGTLGVTGNANVGNLGTGGLITATGNVSGGNLTTAGAVVATGNVSGGNLTTAGVVAATGNVSGGNITTAGLVSATGNVSGGNVNATAKVVASILESNVATGTAPIVVASTTLVTNLNADLLDGYNSDVAATADTVVVRDANANISGNNISGTLSTAAQPNITSVGTLSSLDVTGNITTSANVITDLIVGKTTGITISATGVDQDIELKPTGNGTVDVWSKIISNVATPLASTDAATKGYVDAAVEGLHVHAPSAAATPNTLATISGGTVTYNNGTAGVGATLVTTGTYTLIDGVNIATVGTRVLVKNEANAAHNGIYTYTDSTTLTRATDFNTPTEMAGGDFTFVQNGTLYNDTGWVMVDPVTTVGTSPVIWYQFSGAGTYTAGTGLTLNGTEFSISNTAVTAGAYGNGDYNATFTVNAQGQLTAAANVAITANAANLTGTTLSSTVVNSSLTSVGTLTSLAVTGNATAGNVYANSGTIGASLLTGTLTTASQPNVTSVGTLTTLTVSGNANVGNIGGAAGVFTANVSAGNLSSAGVLSVTGNANVGNLGTAGLIVATGNIDGGNLNTGGAVAATGNVSGGNLTTAGAVVATGNVSGGNLSTAGALSVTGNANVGNLGTGGLITATGNITGGNLTTAGALSVTGNANVGNIGAGAGVFSSTVAATGNVSGGNLTTGGALSVTGNANVGNIGAAAGVFTANVSAGNLSTGGALSVTGNANVGNIGANNAVFTLVTGTLTTAAQPNVTSVGTLTGLEVNGNITAANITANTGVFTGNGSGLTSLTGGNVTGQVGNALVAGTVYTNAQPNITSVGTLTSLAVSGNASAGNISATGDVSGATLTGTLATAAQPNVTSVGTLTSLNVSGNAVVGGLAKLQVGVTSNRANVSVPTATPTLIDSFAPSDYRTAKYVISASGTNGYQSVETLLVHDGTDAYITIYGSICSNVSADIVELSANINGVSGNVTVYATTNSASCVVNLVSSYIKT
jgi:hypothetical protein